MHVHFGRKITNRMMKKYAQKCKQLRTQKSDNKDRHSAICLDHSFWFYLQNQFKIYATQSVVAQLRKTNLQKNLFQTSTAFLLNPNSFWKQKIIMNILHLPLNSFI